MAKTSKKSSTKTKSKPKRVTPLMQQYFGVKLKYPDAILLFRVGDFYETFGEDAVTISKVLGIVLTSRNNGGSDIELAGFPYHSIDLYLPKIVKAGFRVAICEQLEKPSKEKKIVKRGVTDVVTPGVTYHDSLLDNKSNNYLAAVHVNKQQQFGIAFLDISTGEFIVSQGSESLIHKLVQSFRPTEIIYSSEASTIFQSLFEVDQYQHGLDNWIFSYDYGRELLLDQFNMQSLKGFGIEKMDLAQITAGAILHYLSATENRKLQHLVNISRIPTEDYVWLDQFTIRNLELVYPSHPSGKALIDIIDQTKTPMGSRLLKKWITLPLLSVSQITSRQNVVEYFITNSIIKDSIDKQMQKIGDLERLSSKLSARIINPRELRYLYNAINAIIPIKETLKNSQQDQLIAFADSINICESLLSNIQESIVEDPPNNISKGGVIKDGYNSDVDEYRRIINNSKDLLLEIQQNEAKATGITNLKIGFNNVFGYYLEVTNKYKNQGLIPDNWVRKQTLTNAERYITDELKVLEVKILNAQELIQALEVRLFEEIILFASTYLEAILANAKTIANIDNLSSFAGLALRNEYCKPLVDDSFIIDISGGRHPVIEHQLPTGERYIPNDLLLSNHEQQIIMITGPNMSGKSAILRQTALICLMAQMGSYVPAKKAHIGIIDKLFTRVGASDNISSGESTFMVEMNETSSIMNNISDRSLILLDEIGRGTSTYDGISIAWSIASYLHNNNTAQPKTLFATHYHELNELAQKFDRIKNFNVATKEIEDKVIFLRKLRPGGSHHSFGIHVAQIAGMPNEIVRQAKEILKELEQKSITKQDQIKETLQSQPTEPPLQLSFFGQGDDRWTEIQAMLDKLDLNHLTPMDAMLKLKDIMDIHSKNV